MPPSSRPGSRVLVGPPVKAGGSRVVSRCASLAAGALVMVSWGVAERDVSAHQAEEPAKELVGVLAPNTRWETAYHLKESGLAGPKVMLVAGMHGDEPAPPLAAEAILQWQLRAGSLLVVPRASQPALAAGHRLTVDATHPNLNRNFPRSAEGAPRGAMAQALWQLLQRERPDWLVDMHEGIGYHRAGDKSVGSSVIRSRSERARVISELLVRRINSTIRVPERRFDLLGPPAVGSLARAARERAGIHSMILETSTPDPLPVRVLQHQLLVRTLLVELSMIEDDPGLVAAL
jgi:hypothetical protein